MEVNYFFQTIICRWTTASVCSSKKTSMQTIRHKTSIRRHVVHVYIEINVKLTSSREVRHLPRSLSHSSPLPLFIFFTASCFALFCSRGLFLAISGRSFRFMLSRTILSNVTGSRDVLSLFMHTFPAEKARSTKDCHPRATADTLGNWVVASLRGSG